MRSPIRPHIGANHSARREFNLTAEQRRRLLGAHGRNGCRCTGSCTGVARWPRPSSAQLLQLPTAFRQVFVLALRGGRESFKSLRPLAHTRAAHRGMAASSRPSRLAAQNGCRGKFAPFQSAPDRPTRLPSKQRGQWDFLVTQNFLMQRDHGESGRANIASL